ncbi:MAG TPA: metallopeptidase TldD-related protein [Candidatus Saccharimonadales bacterium]|nr:metallopeptidase TldD-related protein [Candidatus Saccharimonadales bacterium]
MAGRNPASGAASPPRLPFSAPVPPEPFPVPLPEGALPDLVYSEARATLTLRREGGSAALPTLVEESGCRVTGGAGGRRFFAVIDSPGEGALDALTRLIGSDLRPIDPSLATGLADRALAWGAILGASMGDARGSAAGATLLDLSWSARISMRAVRIARRETVPLAAPPLEADGTLPGSPFLSTVEVRVAATLERDGRTARAEASRWIPPMLPRDAAGLLEDLPAAAIRRASEILESAMPPAMETPVVFSPAAAGILLHEVCGHLLEGDLVASGTSPFAGRLGEAVAPDFVTIRDDPMHPLGRVRIAVDDEGEGTGPHLLVERGRLAGFLTHRRSAASLGGVSTGNARRESWRQPALPRLTNLIVTPGDADPADLMKGISRGLYVDRLGRGQVDPRMGRFRLEVESGRLVESGRITRPVAGGWLAGSCAQLLRSIEGVGCDAQADPEAGVCIKEDQIVPVGQIAPTLRVASVRIIPGAAP